MKSKLLLLATMALSCSAQVSLPIKISDVTGLSAALSHINTSLDGLTTTTKNQNTTLTNLTTTVTNLTATVSNLTATVASLNATVQSLVPVPIFVDDETPTGLIDGLNSVFMLKAAPSPASSLAVTKSGLKLIQGGDYSLSGSMILFNAGAVPATGDLIRASYRY